MMLQVGKTQQKSPPNCSIKAGRLSSLHIVFLLQNSGKATNIGAEFPCLFLFSPCTFRSCPKNRGNWRLRKVPSGKRKKTTPKWWCKMVTYHGNKSKITLYKEQLQTFGRPRLVLFYSFVGAVPRSILTPENRHWGQLRNDWNIEKRQVRGVFVLWAAFIMFFISFSIKDTILVG